MRDILPELAEPLLVLFYGAIVTALTGVGLAAELAGLSGATSVTSLWLLYVGAVGLVAAAVVARRRLLPLLDLAA